MSLPTEIWILIWEKLPNSLVLSARLWSHAFRQAIEEYFQGHTLWTTHLEALSKWTWAGKLCAHLQEVRTLPTCSLKKLILEPALEADLSAAITKKLQVKSGSVKIFPQGLRDFSLILRKSPKKPFRLEAKRVQIIGCPPSHIIGQGCRRLTIVSSEEIPLLLQVENISEVQIMRHNSLQLRTIGVKRLITNSYVVSLWDDLSLREMYLQHCGYLSGKFHCSTIYSILGNFPINNELPNSPYIRILP